MSLRINNNASSLNAHRNLKKSNARVAKSLERLSSGMRINSAGDGAAELMASEQLRAQIASIDQAIKNSESSISMVQTAEGALAETNNTLVAMRQLALQSANEGSNDDVMLSANQTSIKSMIDSINRVSDYTQFGEKKLLDGSNGVSGTPIGDGLSYVDASVKTRSSDDQGYEVKVEQLASKATASGSTPLSEDLINANEKLFVIEGGKTASYTTKEGDTASSAIRNLSVAAEDVGLAVTIDKNDDGTIAVRHNKYGSEHSFTVMSTTAGVLSQQANTFQTIENGRDLKGTIHDEPTTGKGARMTGIKGNLHTDGLTVAFAPTEQQMQALGGLPAGGATVGKVLVVQKSLTFQIGPDRCQAVDISLNKTKADNLARGVENESGFKSLADVDISTTEGALDSIIMIDAAINEITKTRADLGAFQHNSLAINVANMQIAKENMVAAESSIRDTDMAAEMATFTRQNLLMQSSAAMLAHANQSPRKVLNLLE